MCIYIHIYIYIYIYIGGEDKKDSWEIEDEARREAAA